MARARTPTRRAFAGSSRSVENMGAEFDEMDRLTQVRPAQMGPAQMGPAQMGAAVGSAEHLHLANGPRRQIAYPGPGNDVGPPAADLVRLVRGARRAAIFAAVMSTLALIMAIFAALAAVVGLAA